ncbi:GGDEF domain-containing protein [Pseudomonas tohonis]|uniref:diguanylate cyclase n=1 Tax=Pseudomonas tohonis TaxID=2725477 RepID=A0A6J4DY01_9PSED|nr:sensor domain-containing diguanylate cyclase [Pseudomonas tohonis]BCG22290.1 GGDEF domain-containing protein [Pseudomonas tohonis]GJN53743.1 GGDEF domain-containing protein [Pseudomonas tohonis]
MDELASEEHPYGTTREEIERTLRHALEIVSDGIWDWNMITHHVHRSPGWYAMLGFPRDGLPEDVDTWKSVIHPDDFDGVMQGFQAYLDGHRAEYAEEYRCLCQDGSYLWISDHGRFVEFDDQGRPTRMIGAHRNIHERKLAELALQQRNEELQHINRDLEALIELRTEALAEANRALAEQVRAAVQLAETDPLTSVFNRRKFQACLEHEWQRFVRHGHPTGLLMFDLDHFKRINDSLGHAVGDQVLVAVTACLGAVLREEDCLARWGGEEFIVLLPDTGPEALFLLAQRLHARVPEACPQLPWRLTASFAVAGMQPGESVEALLRRLDEGLYRAKERRDCIERC